MIKAENLDNQRKKQNLLSLLLTSVRQSFQFRKQSSIWFTPILSFSFPNQQLRIKNDLEKQEYEQLLKLLNLLVSDIFLFYKKQINSMLYHLLTVIKTVFGLGDPEEFQQPGLTAFSGFYQFMNQIHLSSTLALLMLKHKQYSIAFQYFDFIINVIEQEKIDIYQDIFLSTVSNYLCLLQMHPINKFPHKTKQLVQMLQNIYQGLLNKFLRKGYQQNNLLTLVSIFKQNQTHLGHRFQLQTKLLLKKFQQTKEGNDKKTDNIQQFLSLNKPFKVGRIDSKPMEMKFLAPSLFNNERERIHRSTDLSDKAKGDLTARNFQTVEHLLRRTGRLGDQFINTNTIDFETIKKNRYKRTLQKQMATIEKQKLITIVKVSPEKRQIQKIENKQQKKEQKKQEKKEEKQEEKKKAASPQKETKKDEIIKRQRVYLKNEVLYFRINYSKMEINNEGIILLDFVQERKKFITWYEVYQILQNVRFSFLFSDFLPICCYYDVARILSYYVYRAHSDDCWGAAILDIPKQIAEIDMLTKFYKDEGPYLKALFLSKYDVTHVQYSINCYLADIEEYFKCANSNEYIDKLNKRILKQKYENEQKYLSLQQWKKKKDQTIQRINNFQFVKIIQDDIAYLRSSLFKIILLLPRKKQILLFIHEKDIKQTEEKGPLIVPISIINIEDVNKKQNRLNIPIYKISRYFPLEPFNLINWVKSYGKFIIEGYISCFFNYPQSFNNMQYFNVITYAKKIQMTNQGKYKTPVIAELIGTKTRIWGISIRYYEQFNTREVSTFILNPYYELLAPIIKLNPSERKKILIDQLLSGSVSATYTKLLQKGFVGKTINIINYWNLIEY